MRGLSAGAIYAAANFASAAVPFMLLPLLTRVLAPADYGLVIGFALVVTAIVPFAGVNVHSAAGVAWFTRERTEMPGYVGTAILIIIITTFLAACVAALVAWLFPALTQGLSTGWVLIAGLTSGCNILLQTRLVLWQSQGKPVHNALLQVSASLLNLGLSLVLVLLFALGGEGRNLGIFVSAIIMALLASILLHNSGDARLSFNPRHLRDLLTYGAPLIPHSFGGVLIGTADRWLVSSQIGSEALGIYGAGAQLGTIMTLLADAFVKAYSPWIFGRLAAPQAHNRHLVVGAIYVAIPLFLVLGALIGTLLHIVTPILLGPNYIAATSVLPWFIFGGSMTGIYMCSSVLFFYERRTGRLAVLSLSAGTIGLVITYSTTMRFGITGASMGFALTQALLAGLVTVAAMRAVDLPWFDISGTIRAMRRRNTTQIGNR